MDDLRSHLRDNGGIVVFVLGLIFLMMAVFSFSMLGSIVTAVTVFFGILMVFLGLPLQLGMFSAGLRSLSGLGMLFVSISVALFALSVAAWQFMEVSSVTIVPYLWEAFVRGHIIYIYYERPYLFISYLCLESGLGLFIIGVGMKIASLLRH